MALILEVRFLMSRAAWVKHTDHVITLAERIYRTRVHQETDLRAYILSHDERFLEPFHEGRKQARGIQPELRKLVAGDPEQTAQNEESFRAAEAWSQWADQAIATTRVGEDTSSVQFQLRGKELMDNYRQIREKFIEREQDLREQYEGIVVILYSCLAKRMSFQGDFPWRPEERGTYEATPRMRLYGVALGALPLLYGLYVLLRNMIR